MAMQTIPFDTHKAIKHLTGSGVSEEHAEAFIDIIRDARKSDLEGLATKAGLSETTSVLRAEIAEVKRELKAEIAELRTELKADIADLKTSLEVIKSELIKWMFVALIPIYGLLISAMGVFFTLLFKH